MILLYRRNVSLQKNVEFLVKASKEHALNLGMFAFLYKLSQCILMNKLGLSKAKSAILAGLIIGLVIWGRKKSNINYQIVLYLLSRDLVALLNLYATNKEGGLISIPPALRTALFPISASLIWGVVMGLHAKAPDSLQEGLRTSMDFLYNDDDHWKSTGRRTVLDFLPFSGQ